MTLTRRKTLTLLGGGTIAAATGFGIHITRPPHAALAPWDQAGNFEDPRMQALSFAILAPNPHNRQPWLVDLSLPDQVTLYVDTDKLLPHTDPFGRQITIGLGCFLEVMRMAAAQQGYEVDIATFPEGQDTEALDARPVAVATFKAVNVQPDPLFAHVMDRRTLKDPFDTTRTVPESALAPLIAAAANGGVVGATVDPAHVTAFREQTHDALVIEIETPHTFKESVDLFRIGRAEVNASPDGIDFTGPMFQTLHSFGLMTRDGTLDTNSTMFAQGKDAVLENADTAMGHIWMTTATNTRDDQINAGRDWVRINLAATGLGLGFQPLSQALQEYPEMAAHYRAIHDKLAPHGETVQMLARLGYGATPARSPRWPIESKIIT